MLAAAAAEQAASRQRHIAARRHVVAAQHVRVRVLREDDLPHGNGGGGHQVPAIQSLGMSGMSKTSPIESGAAQPMTAASTESALCQPDKHAADSCFTVGEPYKVTGYNQICCMRSERKGIPAALLVPFSVPKFAHAAAFSQSFASCAMRSHLHTAGRSVLGLHLCEGVDLCQEGGGTEGPRSSHDDAALWSSLAP